MKSSTPHIVVGTPGRILALVRNKKLNLKFLKHFILDECDKMLEQLGELKKLILIENCLLLPILLQKCCKLIKQLRNSILLMLVLKSRCCCFPIVDMRRDVQEIFRNTPHAKQVMMFSATLSKEIRPVCKKFMQDVIASCNIYPVIT